MSDKCPFCGAAKRSQLDIGIDDYECGSNYYSEETTISPGWNRYESCYDRQIAQLQEALADAKTETEESFKSMVSHHEAQVADLKDEILQPLKFPAFGTGDPVPIEGSFKPVLRINDSAASNLTAIEKQRVGMSGHISPRSLSL